MQTISSSSVNYHSKQKKKKMATILSTRFFLVFFSLALLYISTSTAEELATTICKKTTDFSFCHDALYADPKTPKADLVNLAYIAFRQADSNTTGTTNAIASMLKSRQSPAVRAGLEKCSGFYAQAIQKIGEALGDLDSESYDMVGIWTDVDHAAQGCVVSFTVPSPLNKGNADLLKYSNICKVISQQWLP